MGINILSLLYLQTGLVYLDLFSSYQIIKNILRRGSQWLIQWLYLSFLRSKISKNFKIENLIKRFLISNTYLHCEIFIQIILIVFEGQNQTFFVVFSSDFQNKNIVVSICCILEILDQFVVDCIRDFYFYFSQCWFYLRNILNVFCREDLLFEKPLRSYSLL